MRFLLVLIAALLLMGGGRAAAADIPQRPSDVPPDIWAAIWAGEESACRPPDIAQGWCWERKRLQDGSLVAFGYQPTSGGPIAVWLILTGPLQGKMSSASPQ